jgi:hypothetical protein
MNRSRGRPPLDDDDDSVPVHLTLTATDYDELYRRAQAERISVPEQIRRTLRADAPPIKNPK